MYVSLIIPCYNEADNVAQMAGQLTAIRSQLDEFGQFEVVLVDDGSSDDTAVQLAHAFASWDNVQIIRHNQNSGLGAALRTGFAHANGDVIVTTDSDGTYPFTSIPAMLALLEPGTDVVTASPYHPDGGVDGVPAYRIFISKGASLIYRLLLNPQLHTYTALYRAYRREVIDRASTSSDGFLMVTELLVGALLDGYHVVEFPAVLRVRRYGQSKARIWQMTRAHLRFQAGLIVRRLGFLAQSARHLGGTS